MRNKSSLRIFSAATNNIGDMGRLGEEAVGRRMVHGGETCYVATSFDPVTGGFSCSIVLKVHCLSVVPAALIRGQGLSCRVAGQIKP